MVTIIKVIWKGRADGVGGKADGIRKRKFKAESRRETEIDRI